MTIKPYFTAKNLLIYAAVALFLTAVSGNISSGIGVGLMIGTAFVGYPFALCEKSNNHDSNNRRDVLPCDKADNRSGNVYDAGGRGSNLLFQPQRRAIRQ
jgi:hypothetical protein